MNENEKVMAAQQLSWQDVLQVEQQKSYFVDLMEKVSDARAQGVMVYPPASEVFYALEATPLNEVKVVILGQDPYHGPHQAHGLAFSVLEGVSIPPSLRNIYKELMTDIEGFQIPMYGQLDAWAKQGVLLLNTVLTVEAGKAGAHAKWGWEQLTDALIDVLNREKQHVVFLLWGAHAHKKGAMIDRSRHLVLEAVHPSPLSAHRGFFGCRHFSKTNEYLYQTGQQAIDWQL